MIASLSQIDYLAILTSRLLNGCRITAHDGTTLYVPDGRGHYAALWTRDFAYMVLNSGHLMPLEDIAACIQYLIKGQRADGVIPDRVTPDGRAVYVAGPENQPLGGFNLDNGPFLVLAADWIISQLPLLRQRRVIEGWVKALARGMDVIPLSPSGLVYNDPQQPHSPYGFTDCIAKTGELFLESVLYWEACLALARLYGRLGEAVPANVYIDRAVAIEQSVDALWDDAAGVFLAASHDCRQVDIWGNAYAVYTGLTTLAQQERVLDFLVVHFQDYTWCGQVRHLLKGEHWQRLLTPVAPDTYQNGAYWATASGWVMWCLAQRDALLAQHMLDDLTADFQQNGVYECVNQDYAKLDTYVTSATNPLGALLRLEKR